MIDASKTIDQIETDLLSLATDVIEKCGTAPLDSLWTSFMQGKGKGAEQKNGMDTGVIANGVIVNGVNGKCHDESEGETPAKRACDDAAREQEV